MTYLIKFSTWTNCCSRFFINSLFPSTTVTIYTAGNLIISSVQFELFNRCNRCVIYNKRTLWEILQPSSYNLHQERKSLAQWFIEMGIHCHEILMRQREKCSRLNLLHTRGFCSLQCRSAIIHLHNLCFVRACKMLKKMIHVYWFNFFNNKLISF